MNPTEQQRALSVSEYIDTVNQTLQLIPHEQFEIIGEISDYRLSQGKWINFSLKDEDEEVKIACFATVFKLRMPIEDGMRVAVSGYSKVYERFGRFSFQVESLSLVGEGGLARAYKKLKEQLEKEGLFAADRKRSLPRFPNVVGLITSKEAAAYGDFLRVLQRRWSGMEVIHAPVHVQGQFAVQDILDAFTQFHALPARQRPDILVVTRGGGSLEDLHAFNDEQVARAIFQSEIPVICGVGHERDESLADFVADYRASTPTHAAEVLTPHRDDVLRDVSAMEQRIEELLLYRVKRYEQKMYHNIQFLLRFLDSSVHQLRMSIERFKNAFERFRLSLIATRDHVQKNQRIIDQRYMSALQQMQTKMHGLVRILESYDIAHALRRGFSIIRSVNNEIIKDASQLAAKQQIEIQLGKGIATAEITSKES